MQRAKRAFALFLAVLFLVACETGQAHNTESTDAAVTETGDVGTEQIETEEKPDVQTEPVTETEKITPEDTGPFEYDGPIQIHRETGQLHSVFGYEKDRQYTIHHPQFGVEQVDRAILQQVQQWEQDFLHRNKKMQGRAGMEAMLNIEYSSYKKGDITTVLYRITETASYLAHPEEIWQTFYYDLQKDRPVEINELLQKEALEKIAAYADRYFNEDPAWKDIAKGPHYEEGILPNAANYSTIILKEDGLRVIFEKYQLYAGAEGIPYIDLIGEEWSALIRMPEEAPKTEETETTEEAEDPAPETEEAIETATEDTESQETVTGEAMVALTYDDGPTAENTQRILAALDRVGGHATFFVLGNRVESYPEVMRAIVEQGSEIGNHSYSHPDLTRLGTEELNAQFALTDQAIESVTGLRPALVRPPYGAYDTDVQTAAGRPLIRWSVDTLDWKTRDAAATIDAVLDQVEDGDIILMHDLHESTATASETLIPALHERGYRLVTVSELMNRRGETGSDGTPVFSVKP
ncbi:MAG: polysaccharide deacetylase family protein [Peptoniphilaceae bacterium]|jgi:peptidoglycan/xylan/chitin deacetylase (PgdA/CDA1 family)